LKEKEELEAQLANLRTAPQDSSVSMSLKDIEYPKYWSKQVADYQTFDAKKGSEEWYSVSSEFLKGLPGSKIVRIERNQNKTLWMWYYLKRQLVGSNNNGNPNEMFLFHGSRVDAYDIILKDGLDHRVANLGGAIGAGIYFAPSSGTSAGYVSGTKKGHAKKMMYCRVTLGSVGVGQAGLRRPPEKSKGVLYDSVGSPPTMYVIFDNHQSYPEYVIHYN
jgi:poly [ADP-ribose] polymerase 7/11/12/13